MRQNRISINDIKWDLIRIIEPWDGILENKPESEQVVLRLFKSYLGDMQKQHKIQDFTIVGSIRDTAITILKACHHDKPFLIMHHEPKV